MGCEKMRYVVEKFNNLARKRRFQSASVVSAYFFIFQNSYTFYILCIAKKFIFYQNRGIMNVKRITLLKYCFG